MDRNKIFTLLNEVVLEIEKQQKEELTSNEHPITIADAIHTLDAKRHQIVNMAHEWRQEGFEPNIANGYLKNIKL